MTRRTTSLTLVCLWAVLMLAGCSGGLPGDAETYLREEIFPTFEINRNTQITASRATEDIGATSTVWCVKLYANGFMHYFFLEQQEGGGWQDMGYKPDSLRAESVYQLLGCGG